MSKTRSKWSYRRDRNGGPAHRRSSQQAEDEKPQKFLVSLLVVLGDMGGGESLITSARF